MLFSTPDFIIFFIVVLSIIAAIRYRKFQHVFLLLASYFFFYYSSNYLIILLIASTILDFYVGRAIWNTSEIAKITDRQNDLSKVFSSDFVFNLSKSLGCDVQDVNDLLYLCRVGFGQNLF